MHNYLKCKGSTQTHTNFTCYCYFVMSYVVDTLHVCCCKILTVVHLWCIFYHHFKTVNAWFLVYRHLQLLLVVQL